MLAGVTWTDELVEAESEVGALAVGLPELGPDCAGSACANCVVSAAVTALVGVCTAAGPLSGWSRGDCGGVLVTFGTLGLDRGDTWSLGRGGSVGNCRGEEPMGCFFAGAAVHCCGCCGGCTPAAPAPGWTGVGIDRLGLLVSGGGGGAAVLASEVGTLPPSVAEVFGSLVVGPAFGADGGARLGGFNPYLILIIN